MSLVGWVVEQQEVAKASVEHNRSVRRIMRGCMECGCIDSLTVHPFGRADMACCADGVACAERKAWLLA